MVDIDDYITGHEDDEETFNFEEFRKTLFKWSADIGEELKKNPYDMTLLCVNAVLDSVTEIVYDNIIATNQNDIEYRNEDKED